MKKVFIAVICTFILFFQILTFVNFKSYSEYEMRELKSFPKLNKENIVGGEFSKDFEEALADHAPLKEKMVSINSYLKFLTGDREINGVYLTCGTLYQKPLRNPIVVSLIKEKEKYNNLEVFILPYKMYFSNKMPKALDYARVKEGYVEKYDDIKKYADIDFSDDLELADYYKSDHHLNDKGVEKVLKKLGFDEFEKEQEVTFIGGLRRKTGFLVKDTFRGIFHPKTKNLSFEHPVTHQETRIVDVERSHQTDSYLYYMGGNFGEIDIKGLGEGSLLLIKDSFANPFIGFFATLYDDIKVIDARFYKGKLKNQISNYDKVIIFGGF